MTFRARTGEGAQAIHYNRFAVREDGWAVYHPDTGSCEVTINTGTLGDGDLALTVQSGVALLDGERFEIEEQYIDVPVAQTEPRMDIIALTQDGAVFRAGGDQALQEPESRSLIYSERPAPPDLHNDPVLPLAIVGVPADAEAISTNELRDIRPVADYKVGTINGTDPDDFATGADLDSLTAEDVGAFPIDGGSIDGDLTVADGDQTDFILANNGTQTLRLRALPSGEVAWTIYDENGNYIATTLVAEADGSLSVNNGLDVSGGASVSGPLTGDTADFSGQVTAGSARLSSTGEAGYSMGNGVHYSRDVDGRATIISASADGGDGWALVDPDGVGDAVAVDANGNMQVAGTLDASSVTENGSDLLTALEILDSGTAAGSAASLNFGTDLAVSVTDGAATIDVNAPDGGITSIPISEDGTHLGDVTEFNFAGDLETSVTGDTAYVTGGQLSVSDDGTALGNVGEINFSSNLDATVTDGVASVSSTASGSGSGDAGRSTIRAVDYGADPTGSSSSAIALQDAVNAADPGDTVVWGETGTFYLDDEITINQRIELDLHEGVVESDYHDEIAYPDDQEHYMPLFRVAGTQGSDYSITGTVDKGEDQVSVSDTTPFSIGDGVVLRNSTPNQGGTMPGQDYQPTITRIREIQDGVLFLEDPALREYSSSSGHVITAVDLLTRPIIKNVHVEPRREPAFDTDKGKVLGGPRHIIATELTDRATIENCSAHHYDSHLWSSYDDRAPAATDLEARDAMNLSGSCGEPLFIISSNDVSLVRPKVKEARRGIDVRAGIGTVTVTEPDISGISHIGLSWHNSSNGDPDANITTIGGRVNCKPTDPTMDNDDPDANKRYENQYGYPFNIAGNGHFHSIGTDFVARNSATLNANATIEGGSLHKYSVAGTVLTINADDVSLEDVTLSSYGSVSEVLEIAGGTNINLSDVTVDATATPSDAIAVNGGTDVDIDGRIDGSASDRNVLIQGGTGVAIDLDIECNSNYGYVVNGGENVSINGNLTGSCSNEQIEIGSGTSIAIDANLQASGGTSVRGVRILGGEDIDITGTYRGPGIGVMFSGDATNTVIHDMRIEVTDGSRAAATGTDTSPTALTGVKYLSNDLRGAKDDILMNVDVTGFWAVNNTCSNVETTAGTTIGQVAGNMLY